MKIFFDVDGVLIKGWQSPPGQGLRWHATMEEDLGVSPEAFSERFFRASAAAPEPPMQRCANGESDLKDELAQVLPAIGYQGAVDAFVDYWLRKDSNVNQPLLDLIGQLRENPALELYIASAQEHHRAAYLWHTLGFEAYFRKMLYSAQLGQLKDTPAFFAAINDALGIGPNESPLFFDDRPAIVALAREAGWDACPFKSVEDVLHHPRLQGLF